MSSPLLFASYLSDTSRIHVMVVQGDVVFDALCQLEEHYLSGMQKATRICDDFSQDIPFEDAC